MRNTKFLTIAAFVTLALTSCSDDTTKASDIPDVINEEELITTVNITLTNKADAKDSVTLTYEDLDGEEGPGKPDIKVSGALTAKAVYEGEIEFLNNSGDETEDITKEVKDESEEHQVFYIIREGQDAIANITYTDADSDGKPVGLEFEVTMSDKATENGKMIVILKHEPNKDAEGVEEGDIKNAAGETDIEVEFDIIVE